MWTRTKHVPPPEVLFPGSKHCYCAPQEFTCSASNAGHPRFLKASESWTKKRQSTDKMSGDFLVMILRALNSIDRGFSARPEATCNQDAQQTQFKRPHLGQVAMFHSKLFVYPRKMGISMGVTRSPRDGFRENPMKMDEQGYPMESLRYLLLPPPMVSQVLECHCRHFRRYLAGLENPKSDSKFGWYI